MEFIQKLENIRRNEITNDVLDYFKQNKDASQNLAGPLFEEKVFDFICEMADVKEKKVSVKELYKDDQDEKTTKKSASKKLKSKK